MNPFDALQQGSNSPCKLNVDDLALETKNEKMLARIVAEETEAERNSQRDTFRDFDLAPSGLLELLGGQPKRRRYVDTLPWEYFFANEEIIQKCAGRANMPAHEVASFVSKKCRPENWLAMHYFWAYLAQRHFGLAASKIETERLQQEHVLSLAEAGKSALRERAKKSADVAHEKNRKAKADVFSWCKANYTAKKAQGYTLNDMTDELVKQVSYEFETVRKWLTEWKKTPDGKTLTAASNS